MVSVSRKLHHRRRHRHYHGGADNSVCPSLKTQDECVVCKWNVKTSKCGKAPVRGVSKKSSPKSPKAAKPKAKALSCPKLDKPSCDANDECSWNDKTSKCRKRTAKKGPADKVKKVAAKAKAKSKSKSPVKSAAASPSKSTSPIEIPENKKFREMNLESADFSGMDLRKVTFFACNLKSANFQNADLTDATFSTCELDGANFSGATIIDAEFTYCEVGVPRAYNMGIQVKPLICVNSTIKNTRFDTVRFGNSNYSGTTFEFCDFGDCNSENANFSGCKFTPNPIVRKHVSSVTVIRDCRFQLSNFTNADFRGCEFDSSRRDNLEGCATDEDCGNHFNGCILTGAKFPEKVNMCSFSDAVLTGSDISDPKKDIQGCYFDATTEADDVEELKRRAMPPDDEDEDWNSPVKQKSPSPLRVKSPSPVKAASPVKIVASPPAAAASAAAVATDSNPKCVKQTQKKYLERPSPPYSAADCCGMVIAGNDGKMYVSVPNAKGVCAWKLQK
jgi:uncharacterized protein YjbI with pentapeptide repeats